ncbi:MAG: hypothetical protein NTX72_04765 [Candidatus Uhrbacteria bacterium]|nr:hypothetical protein [Candidatus Uhrbacteria bacterium]
MGGPTCFRKVEIQKFSVRMTRKGYERFILEQFVPEYGLDVLQLGFLFNGLCQEELDDDHAAYARIFPETLRLLARCGAVGSFEYHERSSNEADHGMETRRRDESRKRYTFCADGTVLETLLYERSFFETISVDLEEIPIIVNGKILSPSQSVAVLRR